MKAVSILLIIGLLFIVGCATHIHKVGNGPQENTPVKARQWYILWGLYPLNEVDSQAMTGGATDYEIRTQQNVVDILLGAVLGVVTIQSRTVTVTK